MVIFGIRIPGSGYLSNRKEIQISMECTIITGRDRMAMKGMSFKGILKIVLSLLTYQMGNL
ncbi:hypothetical protein DPMN_070343 [Dreissena polymorpha]|uniref:Uncharacterized protein n=1 Tax=Dreissena polymorpha TaxID=45954 RepID=A0A9D3Z146_DREPO|nr:hypothetical protein DPMN_070343 [Dreissena polymorpha]